MLDGLQGEDVTVYPVSFDAKDEYGNRVKEKLAPVTVPDVLIAPDDPVSSIEDGRPNATEIRLSLFVPKGCEVPWYGATVDIRGERFEVIGDPRPYPPQLVPTERNLRVRCVRFVG